MVSESSSPPPIVLRPYVSANTRIARKTHNEQFNKKLSGCAPSIGLKSTIRIRENSLPDVSGVEKEDLTELRSLIFEFENKLTEAKLQKANMMSQEQIDQLLDQFETLVGELEVARLESARYKREAGILTKALADESRRDSSPSSLERRREDLVERKNLRDEIERLRVIEHEYNSVKTQFEILQKRQGEMRQYEADLIEERVRADRLSHEKTTIENRLDTLIDENKNLKNRLETSTGDLIESRKILNEERDKHADQLSDLTITNSSLQKAVAEMQMSESRWKNRISELEKLLQESRNREEITQGELHALRSNLTGLDEEVRGLAASLTAETQANENLQSRLERVENELKKSESEVQSLRRRDKDISLEMSALGDTVSQNEKLKNELTRLKFELNERDKKIQDLMSSRDLIKRTMGGEIERLQAQLEYTTSRSAALVDKYERLVREKDKMKSLLAHDTMARLSNHRSITNN